MGMFDYVHHENEVYQSKSTPNQALDNYYIEVDQYSGHTYLWVEEYDSEWIDGEGLFGGSIRQFNERKVRCDDFDGLIYFYREDKENGGYKKDAWIEYKALFMNGQLLKIVKL